MIKDIDRTIAPKVKNIGSFGILQPKCYSLSNGIPVFVFENNSQELLKIDVVFEAGSAMAEFPLLATTTNSMLTEATKNYSSADLAEAIDFYGAYFDTVTSRDNAVVSLYSLHKFLPNTLPLLQEVIMHASFEESELKQFIARKKQEFLVNSEKVDFIARQHFTSLLFGKNHPYGKYTTLNDFDAISSQALIDFHDKYYLSGSCRIYVAGHFGEKELALLEANLGSLKNNLNSNEITLNWEKLPSVTKMHKLEKAGAVQNALRLGLVSIHRNHPDYFAVKVLVTILGGYFGSRLMTNIREDKGFTYGIGAGISSFRQESVFFISTEVNSEVVEAAQNEIYAEIRKLQQELVSDDELDTVRNYLLGNIQRSFDGTFSQLDRYKEIDLHNADYTYYTNYIAAVENIDAVSLLEAAKKYLDIDKLYFLNVGS